MAGGGLAQRDRADLHPGGLLLLLRQEVSPT
jgi:hypothetical protein